MSLLNSMDLPTLGLPTMAIMGFGIIFLLMGLRQPLCRERALFFFIIPVPAGNRKTNLRPLGKSLEYPHIRKEP